MRETERRCDALIESSRDPIAYVHEGMHIRANDAYLEMFGYETFEDIEGMSLLDLVAPAHVDEFKQLLKQLSKGEAPPPRYELEARDLEGNALPGGDGVHPGQLRRRVLPADRLPAPGRIRTRNWRARSRNCASATRSPACSTARRSCARSRTPSPEAAHSGAHHGLLLIEPDHYVQLLQEIGLDAADDLVAALAERLRQRARRARHRRAFRRTPVRGAGAQQRPRAHRATGRKRCAPPSPTM